MVLGSSNKHNNRTSSCSPSTLFAASLLVIATIACTRFVDYVLEGCEHEFSGKLLVSQKGVHQPYDSMEVLFRHNDLSWPERGYGTHLSLRIYVYDVGEIDGLEELLRGHSHNINHADCIKGQWGTQVKIHKFLMKSEFRTLNKNEADFFFVPTYVKCVRMNGGLTDKEINQKFVHVLQQMPHFRLSGGRDHIFVFPSGAGAHLFKQWAMYLNRSIFLTPEGDRTDKRDISAFNTWKDIIIPGNIDLDIDFERTGSSDTVNPIPLIRRKHLANFLGRPQGKVGRLQLLELAKQFPDELEAPLLTFSGSMKLGHKVYFGHLSNAKFCLAPRGESSWTLRFYEAFFAECVPVILSDKIELPFQNVLDYTRFSIKWPASHISEELLQYLRSIPDQEIERMIARGRVVRCLWLYSLNVDGCSAMTGILWELQRKVRTFHQSSETFWLHNRSIVDQSLIEFSQWRSPFPLL